MDINPADAKELGVEDGDYVWIDPDPEDRPFRGWQNNRSRLRVLAALVPGPLLPRHAAGRHADVVQHVRGHARFATGPGRAGRRTGQEPGKTNYQAMFRSGSHQSATRGWLKPTWMTDSLVRKGLFGQGIGKGFLPDVHCPTGAPREAIVKITRAEPGGIGGQGPLAARCSGYPARLTRATT